MHKWKSSKNNSKHISALGAESQPFQWSLSQPSRWTLISRDSANSQSILWSLERTCIPNWNYCTVKKIQWDQMFRQIWFNHEKCMCLKIWSPAIGLPNCNCSFQTIYLTTASRECTWYYLALTRYNEFHFTAEEIWIQFIARGNRI